MTPLGPAGDGTLHSRYRRIGLGFGNANFDPAAGLIAVPSPGEGDGKIRLIKESVQYARVLLDGHKEEDCGTAHDILRAVRQAGWQAAGGEPDSGLETVQAMLEMLYRHGSRLDAEAKSFMEAEAKACCESEQERWVSPVRTGSALLAASCMICGGEWLRNPDTARRGREKLEEVAECARGAGAIDEYNSPNRAAIMLHALGAVLSHSRDADVLRSAGGLWRAIWLSLLEHAHPATAQIAGPHSRTAGRDMRRDTRGLVKYYMHRAFGPAFPLGSEAAGSREDLFAALITGDPDCPDDLKRLAGRLKTPRSVTEIVGSYSGYRPAPADGKLHPADAEAGRPGLWAELLEHKGHPGRPGFFGSVKRIMTYLSENYCIGSVNCESLGGGAAPILAHWTSGRQDRANYLAVLGVAERAGQLDILPGAVMCSVQQEGRILGLLRFESGADGRAVRAGRGALAFQINRDCSPEVVAIGEQEPGPFRLDRGVIVRAEGILVGIRILRARLAGASVSARISEMPAPCAHPEGEVGMHLTLEPFSPVPGETAYAAFALEIGDEEAGEGVSGMTRRLRTARVADESPAEGTIRLAWGGTLSLSASTRVLPPNSWMSREGSIA